MAPATVKSYAEYDGKYWAVPAEGDATGWAYRKDWFEDPAEMEAFKAKYGYDLARAEDLGTRCATSPSSSTVRTRAATASRIYTDNSYDALVMGVENALFTYGGELGDYSTYKVDGIINSDKAVAALEMYRELYQFTPPNWGKTFFQEDNQAITEGLAAMSMNYFAFFPALTNPATNPNAEETGYFANPAGPDGEQHAALGGQGISVVSYSQNQEEAMKFLEWFIRDDVQKRWAELGGYTASAAMLESRGVPQRHALQRGLLPVDVHGEGLLGGAGVRRAADPDEQPDLSLRRRRRGHGQGGARRARRGLGRRRFKKYGRLTAGGPTGPGARRPGLSNEASDRERRLWRAGDDSTPGPGRRRGVGAISRSGTCSSFRRSRS